MAALTAPVISYVSVPAIQEFWTVSAARGFGQQLLMNAVGTLLLGATSVFVTRTLYGLRKTAFRAQRLGNYVLHKEIGEGGMGRVYVAEHALMCRPSAVKVLKASGGVDQTALARFEREVRLSSSLSHPNTITIFDFGRAGQDTFYYAMEYLEGMDLARCFCFCRSPVRWPKRTRGPSYTGTSSRRISSSPCAAACTTS